MKKIIIFMLLALIVAGMTFAAETDSMTIDISLTVDPQIVAHKQADIVMSLPDVLGGSDDPADVGGLASGSGSIGYFDSNASTSFSFQASALDNEASGGDDVMTTRYVASFSGFGGDAVDPYESGDVENPDLDDLEGTRTVVPHSGRIDIDLDVEADVEWEDDAGLYGSQFVVTAVVN
ncbi:MAG: hypothetical protein JEY99_20755 [Spirochaetales bacterium]|nr:hypothetical protein [Spirochaetales bacterium]